jgi:hypothetical protein
MIEVRLIEAESRRGAAARSADSPFGFAQGKLGGCPHTSFTFLSEFDNQFSRVIRSRFPDAAKT